MTNKSDNKGDNIKEVITLQQKWLAGVSCDGIYDGGGLLLGPQSHIKNIPIIVWIV